MSKQINKFDEYYIMSIIPLYSFLKTKLDKVSAGPLKWTVCFGYEEAEITQK